MSSKQTILIVDDFQSNILMLSACLEDCYHIAQATSGEQCIDIASVLPQPDLILLDIIMPGMDGYETCRQLKQNPKTRDIPVIFVSQKDQTDEVVFGLNIGAADYIKKPFDPYLVMARVKTQLTLRHQYETLANKEAMLEAILTNSPVLISTKDLDGKIISANRQFELLEGVNPEDYIGKDVLSLYPDKDREEILKSEQASKINRLEVEENLKHKDGTEHTYSSIKFPIFNSENELLGTGTISSDITNRIKSEQAMRQIKKMEAVGQLTGGIAHDFNNILGVIMGNIELLSSSSNFNEKELKRLKNISKVANRAAHLTSQLLGFSRVKPVSSEVVKLEVQIDQMDQLVNASLTQRINIVKDFEPNLWLVKIDSGDFQDAYLNLLLNAQDAMQKEGELNIKLSNCVLDEAFCKRNPGSVSGEHLKLTVKDSGEGISKDNIEKIFNPFFTTKETGKGSGLGLSMVFGFVKRSNGYINVRSTVGEGAQFNIYLPKAETERTKKITAKTSTPTGNETLLLVDDEVALLESTKDILEMMGYKVITASSGAAAIEKLEVNSNISLVVSDVIMPGEINGYNLLEHCKINYPEIKFLLCSGYDKTSNYKEVPKHYNLLAKPYSREQIGQKIREVLQS